MCCEYFINNLSRMEEYRDVDIFLKMIRGTLPPFENFVLFKFRFPPFITSYQYCIFSFIPFRNLLIVHAQLFAKVIR